MENSTSTDVDRSCNIRKVQFELRCGFAETYFTDIHSRDKFGIAICLWTQHLTVLPVSWVSEIQLQLFSSHAVISHGFLTNSTQRWLLFLSSLFVVLFGASSSSSSSSLIGPCASPSLSTGVIPFHLDSQSVTLASGCLQAEKGQGKLSRSQPLRDGEMAGETGKSEQGRRGKKAWRKRGKKTSWISNKSPCELLIVSSDCLHFGAWSLIPYRFRPVIFGAFLHDMTPVKKQA